MPSGIYLSSSGPIKDSTGSIMLLSVGTGVSTTSSNLSTVTGAGSAISSAVVAGMPLVILGVVPGWVNVMGDVV